MKKSLNLIEKIENFGKFSGEVTKEYFEFDDKKRVCSTFNLSLDFNFPFEKKEMFLIKFVLGDEVCFFHNREQNSLNKYKLQFVESEVPYKITYLDKKGVLKNMPSSKFVKKKPSILTTQICFTKLNKVQNMNVILEVNFDLSQFLKVIDEDLENFMFIEYAGNKYPIKLKFDEESGDDEMMLHGEEDEREEEIIEKINKTHVKETKAFGFGVSLCKKNSFLGKHPYRNSWIFINNKTPYFLEDMIDDLQKSEMFDECSLSLFEKQDTEYTHLMTKKFENSEDDNMKEEIIIDMFVKRFKEVKAMRKKLTLLGKPHSCEEVLKNLKYPHITEIDVYLQQLFQIFSEPAFGLGVLKCACDEGVKAVRVFPNWFRYRFYEKKIKEKFKLHKVRITDESKDNKFLRNIFNQMQMLINLKKTKILDEKGNAIDTKAWFSLIDTLPEDVNLFIYNLSFLEGDTTLRNVYHEEIAKIHEKIPFFHSIIKKNHWIDSSKRITKKMFFFEYDEQKNTLYLYIPFGASSNVGTFFECFKTQIKTQALKSPFYKINGFKLFMGERGKETINDVGVDDIREVYSGNSENYTFFMENN